MMRSPHAWGIAVRKPSGQVVTHSEALERPSEKHKWMAWPIIRGVVTLGHAMMLGFRALRFSANAALEDAAVKPEEKIQISGWLAAVNIIVSLGFFIVAYKLLPLVMATGIRNFFARAGDTRAAAALQHSLPFNLLDGAIRIAIFLLFIWGISRWKDIHRVFEYHGAEHKTVFAFESGRPVDVVAAQSFSTYHPRCGTSFLMTVMLISIVFYAMVPVTSFWARFAVRILLLPLIAGVSYELIRFAARLQRRSPEGSRLSLGSSLFVLLTRPGMWLQRITTQPPADSQVECAIRALDQAMALEKQTGGELVIA